MKLAIIYHSVSGNTKKAAEFIKAGMEKVEGVEAIAVSIEEASEEDLADVSGIVFGAPTYYANLSWQMLQFLETTKLPLADKLGGVFSTANVTQGGSEIVLQNMLVVMLARGMTVYSGGTSHGRPFTHIGANAFAVDGGIDAGQELMETFGERFAKKAAEYFA